MAKLDLGTRRMAAKTKRSRLPHGSNYVIFNRLSALVGVLIYLAIGKHAHILNTYGVL